MGPVSKRAIPVRQQTRARQVPLPTTAASKSSLPPKVQGTQPVNAVDSNLITTQSERLGASTSVKESSASCDLRSRIGSKVCLGGTKTGTFLFYGKTNFSDGIWCGVSLDEPNGKNDGSVNGIRYFMCLPAHGVFVRPIKLEFLQSIDTGKDAAHRTLPNVSSGEMVQASKLPVSSALRRLGGFGFSGKIQKHGSSQKKMGLKRKILLGANLNSTITTLKKEANTNSTENVADSAEKHHPQFYKTPKPLCSNLQKFPECSMNSGMKRTLLAEAFDDLPSSSNSTISTNLNRAITVPCHVLNDVDKLPISSDPSKNPSASNDFITGISGPDLDKLSDKQQPETLCSTTLDGTVNGPEYCNSVTNSKSPATLSRRSLELFMKLSPSKTSSPLQLQFKYPINANVMDLSFEIPNENSLTSDVKVSQHSSKGSRTLLATNDEDKSLQQICNPSQALLANQTIVIEACDAEEEQLNLTFQVEEQVLHADKAETSFSESAASCQTHFKCAPNLPIIEEDEQSIEEQYNSSLKTPNIVQLPIESAESTLEMHMVEFKIPFVDDSLKFERKLDSTICIASEASVTNATPTGNNVSATASVEEKTILAIKNANAVQLRNENIDSTLSSTKGILNSTICISSEASATNAPSTVSSVGFADNLEEQDNLSMNDADIIQHTIKNTDSTLSSIKGILNSTICISSEASVTNAPSTVSSVGFADNLKEQDNLSMKNANIFQRSIKNADSLLASKKINLNSTICISSEASGPNVTSTVNNVCFADNLEEQDNLSLNNANIFQRPINNADSTLLSSKGILNSTICISSEASGPNVTSTVNNVCSANNLEEQDNLSLNNANIFQRTIKNTDSTLSSIKGILNSTICISSEASGPNPTPTVNSAVNLNETFCYNTSASSVTNTSTNAPSLFQPENCKEPAVEHGGCQPVASTPACRLTRAQFLPTLCTPILQTINIDSPISLNQSSMHMDLSPPMLPGEMTDSESDPSQVSTNSNQSLGILSLSKMQNFTVDATTNSLLEVDSPLTASFCNRMFPVDADYKMKGRFPSVSQIGTSPDHLQRQPANTLSMQAFRNVDKINSFTHSETILNPPGIAKENVVPLLASPALRDYKKSNKRVLLEASPNPSVQTGRRLAKCSKLQFNESLLDLSACADVALPDDSLLDLSACADVELLDNSILDIF